jgi:hypothetical protein
MPGPSLPVPLPSRDERLRDVFARKAATSREILAADFGAWPPNGLAVTEAPQGRVELRSMFRGAARTAVDLWHISRGIAKADGVSRLRHAAEAVPFLAVTFFSLLLTNPGMVNALRPHIIYLNPFVSKGRSRADILSHEHTHVLQRSSGEGKDDIYGSDGLTKGLCRDSAGDADYIGKGSELQARLHVLLVNAYAQTQLMPASLTQFWQVLMKAGVLPPVMLGAMLLRDEKTLVPQLRALRELENGDARELESFNLAYLKPELRMKFWVETLPALYADLLALYGDQATGKAILAQRPDWQKFAAQEEAILSQLRQESRALPAPPPQASL